MEYKVFFKDTNNIKYPGEKVGVEIIEKFEEENDISVPDVFKNFLLETNGGNLLYKNVAFLIEDFYGDQQLIIVERMSSFVEFSRELKEVRTQKDYVFEDFEKIAIIGRCRMREFIFIGISKDNFGKIYFAPDDNVTDFVSMDNDSSIYPIFEIASDLDTFLIMLKHPGEYEPSFYED